MAFTDYIPTCDWVRNYRAMKDIKLRVVLAEFEHYERGTTLFPDAVRRVMENGGDIAINHNACLAEAMRRGLRRKWPNA